MLLLSTARSVMRQEVPRPLAIARATRWISTTEERLSLIHIFFPDVKVKSIRGNLQTRLEKLDSGEYSALVLAAAGLKRLGLEKRISRYFDTEEILPAAGQGILAVQGKKGLDYEYLKGYDDPEAHSVALAERCV